MQLLSTIDRHLVHNLHKPASADRLAERVGLGSSGFYKSFKEVMYVSPLQYAKSVKLHKAQAQIQEGKKANEAGYWVGCNSPSQFSREYKRHFGFAPSATYISGHLSFRAAFVSLFP